jgi:hypothetical protein
VRPLAGGNRLDRPLALLVAAAAGLTGIGVWPNYLYALVWVAPLLIMVALRSLRQESHPLQHLATTDWTRPASAMLAAVICGVFWEMWNVFSLAQWRYSIPFVHRFEFFAMPLLGYAGYLPFGLECAAVRDVLEGLLPSDGARPEKGCPTGADRAPFAVESGLFLAGESIPNCACLVLAIGRTGIRGRLSGTEALAAQAGDAFLQWRVRGKKMHQAAAGQGVDDEHVCGRWTGIQRQLLGVGP